MSWLGLLRQRSRVPQWTQALPSDVTYRSPLDFEPAVLADLMRRGAGVARETPDAVRTLRRRGAAFQDDPDGARLFDAPAAVEINQPPVFVAAAERVFLVGSRTYVTAHGTFFNDEAYDGRALAAYLKGLAGSDPFANEYSGVRAVDGEGFRLARADRPIRHLSGDVVSLCSLEAGNPGSFLFRALPKLASLPDLRANWTILAPPLWPANRELLGLAGVQDEKIVAQEPGVIYAIDRAIVPSLRNPHCLLDEASLALYARLRKRYGGSGRRKIFVSRAGWSATGMGQRPMLNEPDVIAELLGLGFEVVRPHELTAREQIACFASASVVVGAAGSALFNTVFCQPGTKVVDIESEPHWIFTHANLFGSCGLEYGIVQARSADNDWSQPHKPFTVNVAALADRVARL